MGSPSPSTTGSTGQQQQTLFKSTAICRPTKAPRRPPTGHAPARPGQPARLALPFYRHSRPRRARSALHWHWQSNCTISPAYQHSIHQITPAIKHSHLGPRAGRILLITMDQPIGGITCAGAPVHAAASPDRLTSNKSKPGPPAPPIAPARRPPAPPAPPPPWTFSTSSSTTGFFPIIHVAVIARTIIANVPPAPPPPTPARPPLAHPERGLAISWQPPRTPPARPINSSTSELQTSGGWSWRRVTTTHRHHPLAIPAGTGFI